MVTDWLAYYEMLRSKTANELKSMWEETTEEDYYNMLECLPPLKYNGNTFLVGERMTHSDAGAIYEAFTMCAGRYFKRPAPAHKYDPEAYTAEIRAKFNI